MAAAFQDGIIHVLSSSSDEDTEVDEAHSEGETEVDEASLLLLRSREEEEFCQPSVEQDAKRQSKLIWMIVGAVITAVASGIVAWITG